MKIQIRDVMYTSNDDLYDACVYYEGDSYAVYAGPVGQLVGAYYSFLSAAERASDLVREYERNRSTAV
jgi:hypothetical protein